MRVTSLTLSDWKGLSEAIDLDRFNFLVGPNGSGKTGLLSSLSFAIEGKAPDRGARLEDIARFCGNAGGSVQVTLDDGFGWSRGLSVNHATREMSSFCTIAGKGNVGVKQAASAIAERIGKDGRLFAPMFDLGEFLNLSPDKRREFVLSLCADAVSGELSDTVGVRGRINRFFLETQIGEGTVEQALAAGRTLFAIALEKLSAPMRDAHGDAWKQVTQSTGADLATYVANLIADFNNVKNLAASNKDEGRAAARKLSEQLAAISPLARSENELAADLGVQRDQRDELVKQLANQAGRSSAIASLSNQVFEASQDWERHDKTVRIAETAPKPEGDPAALDAEAEAIIQAAHDKRPDATAAREKLTNAAKIVGLLKTERERKQGELSTAKAKLASIEARHAIARNSAWRQVKELLDVVGGDEVLGPMLGALSHWEHAREIVDAQLAHDGLDKLAIDRDALAGDVDRLDSEVAAVTTKLEAAADVDKEAQRAHDDAIIAFSFWEKAQAQALAQSDKLRRQADAIRTQLIRLEDQRLAAIGRREAATKTRIAKERELEALLQSGGHLSADSLTDQKESIEVLIQETDAALQTKRRFAGLEADYRTCLAKAEADETLWTVSRDLCKAAKRVREEIMASLAKPLMDEVNAFLMSAMGSPCGYCELVNFNESPTFDIGWEIDGHRRPYEALSGGEKVLFGAALAVAMVKLANPKLKLLLLEAGECDVDTLDRMCFGIDARCAEFANVVVTTHIGQADRVDGAKDWKVIERTVRS